jgi:anti-sigma regulatory factor (Ser/Thr protein kinase)
MKVLIAAGEAVGNAIEHGHRHSPDGTICLGATAASLARGNDFAV